MENSEIQFWAESIVRETRSKWETLKNEYACSKSGFAVFYSPPRENPDLMIIGMNPGGDKKKSNFNEMNPCTIPTTHEYFDEEYSPRKYPLAYKMKDIFSKINKPMLLKESVKLNLIFFRTKGAKQYKEIPLAIRKDMEEFSFKHIKKIICELKPKFILTEGLGTYDKLKGIIYSLDIPLLHEKCEPGVKASRIYCKADVGAMKIIGMLHPSGARIKTEDSKSIRKFLSGDLVQTSHKSS